MPPPTRRRPLPQPHSSVSSQHHHLASTAISIIHPFLLPLPRTTTTIPNLIKTLNCTPNLTPQPPHVTHAQPNTTTILPPTPNITPQPTSFLYPTPPYQSSAETECKNRFQSITWNEKQKK
ncbi:hypothetical protein RJT34_17748 [Clitoria ternatea]|uniref:Uncharacterized protein n=1 Tax=Clitoria ternatea TaxID=43366 RepID=A0AAN9JAU1_CLITE